MVNEIQTLKEIALELLYKYEDAETSVILEYSGSIDEDFKALERECSEYHSRIESIE